MSGVGITYIWVNKEFPPFVRLEGKRGDYEVYTPERTCNLIEDGDLLHCSNCGGAAEKQLWAYWSYCPNCGSSLGDDYDGFCAWGERKKGLNNDSYN